SDMILKLLRGKGVLSDEEYRLALAEAPNIGRLQKKVEESIKQEEVFPNRSSAGGLGRESVQEEKSGSEGPLSPAVQPADKSTPVSTEIKEPMPADKVGAPGGGENR
ncbi:MAG TPA: transglycosylase, partial [Geobacteraceae bacterium]